MGQFIRQPTLPTGGEKNPRLLAVSHSPDMFGAPRSLLSLLDDTHREIDWRVACYGRGEFVDRLRASGLGCVTLPKISFPEGKKILSRAKTNLRWLFAELHATARLLRIVSCENCNLVYANTITRLAPCLVASLASVPLVVHVRENENRILRWGGRNREIVRVNMQRANRLICVSRSVQDSLLTRGATREKTLVIYNGVAPKRDRGDREPNEGQSSPSQYRRLTLGFLGAFSERKGFPFFLDLAIELCERADIQCLAVGGTEEGVYRWEKLIPAHLANRVILGPFRRDTDSFFQEIDIFCMTSFQEPFARVNLEAASYGLPIVASAVDGNKELFEDGVNAELCRPGDKACFRRKILELVEDPVKRSALGERARDTVREDFTLGQCHRQVVALLREELNRR